MGKDMRRTARYVRVGSPVLSKITQQLSSLAVTQSGESIWSGVAEVSYSDMDA